MDNELEELKKIDLVRERIRCSYEEARKALASGGGSVIEALVRLERERSKDDSDVLALARDLTGELESIARAGEIRSMRIKFGDRVLREIPVAAAATAAVMLSILAVLVSQTSIELVRRSTLPSGNGAASPTNGTADDEAEVTSDK